jgi:hypothetical protein
LDLGNCAPFAVLRSGDGLILLPEQRRFERLCEQVSARLTGAGLRPDAILATPAEFFRALCSLFAETTTGKAPFKVPRIAVPSFN